MNLETLFTPDPGLLTIPKLIAVAIGALITAAFTGCGVQLGTTQYWDSYTDRLAEVNRPGKVELVESPPPNVEREKLYRAAQTFGIIPPQSRTNANRAKYESPWEHYSQDDRKKFGAILSGGAK